MVYIPTMTWLSHNTGREFERVVEDALRMEFQNRRTLTDLINVDPSIFRVNPVEAVRQRLTE